MVAALIETVGQRWTPTDELLAQVVESLDLIWRQLVANGGGRPPSQQRRVPRPSDRITPGPMSGRQLAQLVLRGG